MAVIRKITKSGETRYLVRVRDSAGGFYSAKSFTKKAEADAHERKLIGLKEKGGLAQPLAVRSLTVLEYVEQWKRAHRSDVSDGWKISQDQLLRDYIIPVIGSLRLSDIRSPHIGRILQQMKSRDLSDQQRLHVYNLLHRIFDCAVEYDEVISQSPVSLRDRPQVQLVERTSLSPDQLKRLLEASKSTPWAPAIWIACLAGLRTSELQGLVWDAVDFNRNLIHIKQAYKRKVGKMEPFPKQRRHGSSPMVPQLKELLLSIAVDKQGSDFVTSSDPKIMMDHQWLNRGLNRLCKEANVPLVTPHELRHSCTELWLDQGASEEDIVRLLNHSGAGSVRRYIHKSPDRLLRIAQGISINLEERSSPTLRVVK
jgi:integrase